MPLDVSREKCHRGQFCGRRPGAWLLGGAHCGLASGSRYTRPSHVRWRWSRGGRESQASLARLYGCDGDLVALVGQGQGEGRVVGAVVVLILLSRTMSGRQKTAATPRVPARVNNCSSCAAASLPACRATYFLHQRLWLLTMGSSEARRWTIVAPRPAFLDVRKLTLVACAQGLVCPLWCAFSLQKQPCSLVATCTQTSRVSALARRANSSPRLLVYRGAGPLYSSPFSPFRLSPLSYIISSLAQGGGTRVTSTRKCRMCDVCGH